MAERAAILADLGFDGGTAKGADSGQRERAVQRCRICGEVGHRAPACPQRPKADLRASPRLRSTDGGAADGAADDAAADLGAADVDWGLDKYNRYNNCVCCGASDKPLFVCDNVLAATSSHKKYTCPMVFDADCLTKLNVAVPSEDDAIGWNCPLCSGMSVLPDDSLLRLHQLTGVRTAQHHCGELELCHHGCGAYMWPAERGRCCSDGKFILTSEFNPPMDPEYRELLMELGLGEVCKNSRFLNGHVSFGTVGHVPS